MSKQKVHYLAALTVKATFSTFPCITSTQAVLNYFLRCMLKCKSHSACTRPTRHASSQSHEGNGVDTILEVNEAAEMAGNVTNDRGAQTHRGDGYHEGGITIGNG